MRNMYDLLRPKNAIFTNNGTKNLGMVSREIYFYYHTTNGCY